MEKKFVVRDRETGTIIDRFSSEELAYKALAEFEEADLCEGIFEPDFYEVTPLY